MDNRRLLSPTGTTLEPLEKAVYQQLKKHRGQLEGRTLVVAVSGGIDSVVLLHVLHGLQSRLGYKLHIAHINHGVRGRESDADQKFVKRLSEELKVPLTQRKLHGIDVTAGENLLRKRRYEVLFQTMQRLKATYVVTAHHKDDLLETRLMRLLQGTGVHGLKAMTVINNEGVLRPLLHVTRRDIELYAKKKDLEWRNDATNHDTTKFRNWIRRNWLGVLKQDHPEYVPTLFNSLERLILDNKHVTVEPLPEKTFDRTKLLKGGMLGETDDRVYVFLKQHAKTRITSRHVTEFKKQLVNPRKNFSFRLAGVDWKVEKQNVQPD
jgi:tRNA(Ile)-lysidine synthase